MQIASIDSRTEVSEYENENTCVVFEISKIDSSRVELMLSGKGVASAAHITIWSKELRIKKIYSNQKTEYIYIYIPRIIRCIIIV